MIIARTTTGIRCSCSLLTTSNQRTERNRCSGTAGGIVERTAKSLAVVSNGDGFLRIKPPLSLSSGVLDHPVKIV